MPWTNASTNPSVKKMKTFAFTVSIAQRIDDLDAIDHFYGKTGDASISGSGAAARIHFDREADSLEKALRSAVKEIQQEGWTIGEITLEQECVSDLAIA